MDQNMDNPNPAGENQPPQSEPQTPPQPEQTAPEQPPVPVPPTAEVAEEPSKDAKMWGMFCHLAAQRSHQNLGTFFIKVCRYR